MSEIKAQVVRGNQGSSLPGVFSNDFIKSGVE
jgi:hypothetical protein